MAANPLPIFSRLPDVQIGAAVTAANTAMDGTGTVQLLFTADATNGGFVQRVIVRALGSCAASALRIFINNGATPTTATNNALIADTTLPATTASNTVALAPIDVPIGFALPAGWRLYMTIGAVVTGGWIGTTVAGKY
jgi:hypothetical protein